MVRALPYRRAATAAIMVAVALALIEIAVSAWTFFNARDAVWETLEQSTAMQAHGLEIAVSSDLASRDYGAMESRIRQTMANRSVRSALVTNRDGKILAFLQRAQPQLEPTLIFDAPNVLPPGDPAMRHYDALRDDHQVTGWATIELGQPLGFVQLKVSTGVAEAALAELRRETLTLAALGAVTGVMMLFALLTLFYRQVRAHDTAMLASQQVLENEAHHDHLTGLANRQLLIERMQQAMSHATRHGELMAVCFLDLDGFKAVNDEHGHDVGDLLLREVAHRLNNCVRADDTVSRLGGDEFILLLADAKSVEGCELILTRVLDTLNAPMRFDGRRASVGASIGVTYYPRAGSESRDAAALLAEADKAMYEAKRAGRHRWHTYAPAALKGAVTQGD